MTSGSTFQRKLPLTSGGVAVDLLAAACGLSKSVVKDWMGKGGVWLRRGPGAAKRLRRATAELRAGDTLELYYDAQLLARDAPPAVRQFVHAHYSVWFKPAGLLSQGTLYADHCSLLRYVEKQLASGQVAHLIHRLDREAQGLMMVAHHKAAAARLSALFQNGTVHKSYKVTVVGDLTLAYGSQGEIDLPLDDKHALTRFCCVQVAPDSASTQLDVDIVTGRLHQIRRHFAAIGHPVVGDPKYGKNNKNKEGLQLTAYRLAFMCPWERRERVFTLSEEAVVANCY